MNPAPDRESEFEERLKQGVCVRDNSWDFGHGVVKSKYFVVLNKDCTTPDLLVLLTTSQQGFYRENPSRESEVVRLLPEKVAFFTEETILNCRDVYPLDRGAVKSKFVQKHMEFLGDLPADEFAKVLKTIRASRQIAKKIRKLICGND